MKNYIKSNFFTLLTAALALAAISLPPSAYGKNSSGGGSTKIVEDPVTGYVTAIDYDNSTIQIGASYYGSGSLLVTSDTSISFNNTSCSFEDLEVGDWVEARYIFVVDATTGQDVSIATRLSAIGVPTS